MKLFVIEMEGETQQQKNKSNDKRPYTIRFYKDENIFNGYRKSRTDQKLDFNYKYSLSELHKLLKEIKKEAPRVVEIQLIAHGGRDGTISFEGKYDGDTFYSVGWFIKELLENGVEKVYIKTSPCYGGCYIDIRKGKGSVFQIIKKAIEKDTPKEKAKELINKVYCSTTRAGIGMCYHTRMNNHATGYCRDKTVPWYQKLRYKINEFFRFFALPYRNKQDWFADMSRSKRNAMGFLIGSEGRIYFPLRDADKFTYDEYFTNPKNAKKLHKKYSGPDAKERAYEFLGLGDMEPKINNEEVKTKLRDKNMWKSYYTSGCPFSS